MTSIYQPILSYPLKFRFFAKIMYGSKPTPTHIIFTNKENKKIFCHHKRKGKKHIFGSKVTLKVCIESKYVSFVTKVSA